MKKEHANLILPDTNVLIGDVESINKFINDGNLVVIALTVLQELDRLKSDWRIGAQVRCVTRQIEDLVFSGSSQLIIERKMDFSNLNLDEHKPDDKIIATFHYILNNNQDDCYQGFNKYKLVSIDKNMRIIAYSLLRDFPQAVIEDYQANLITPTQIQQNIPVFSKKSSDVSFAFDDKIFGNIVENGGVLIKDEYEIEENTILLMRKGEKMLIVPKDFNILGVKPIFNNKTNWGQLLAMKQLMDNSIHAVFLEGPAGTGKTLLAMAAALEQKKNFDQLVLVNPMVPLSNKEKMGFLPGDQRDKMAPWMLPFEQNIRFLEKNHPARMRSLKGLSRKKKGAKISGAQLENEEKMIFLPIWEQYGFTVQPLEYIRGQTISGAFIIVEETQNITQHEIKTIITRVGSGTKIIFCGDLSQTDDQAFLSPKSSGLTYAIERLVGTDHESKMVAASLLTSTVRSKLASYASKKL